MRWGESALLRGVLFASSVPVSRSGNHARAEASIAVTANSSNGESSRSPEVEVRYLPKWRERPGQREYSAGGQMAMTMSGRINGKVVRYA